MGIIIDPGLLCGSHSHRSLPVETLASLPYFLTFRLFCDDQGVSLNTFKMEIGITHILFH